MEAAELLQANGLPAVLLRYRPAREIYAPRVLLRLDTDASGRVAEIQSVLATRKLVALPA